jgi:hypothetical protein
MNWDKFFASPALMDSAARRLRERSVRIGDCIIWQGSHKPGGYGTMRVGQAGYESTHRIAWAISNGRRPASRMHVMHSCDARACVNPSHLSIGTAKDNQRDCIDKGRKNPARGALHSFAKLTEPKVILAASLFASGHTYREISTRVGVTWDSIQRIILGRGWSHVQDQVQSLVATRRQHNREIQRRSA